jgi:uncharacterized protein (DUF305 family)
MQHMQEGKHTKQGHYGRLMAMVALSFIAMYIPQILQLCQEIVSSQRAEIAQMKAMLATQ